MQEQYVLQDDEIDLRKLFKTIWKKKVFIIIFTLLFSTIGIIYAYNKTPVYEGRAVLEIGSFDYRNRLIEPPANMIYKMSLENPSIKTVSLINGSKNLIEIIVQSNTSKDVKKNLEMIIYKTIEKHRVELDNYKKQLNRRISYLVKEKVVLEQEKKQLLGEVIAKLEIIKKISNVKNLEYYMQETKQIGSTVAIRNPIKPKKKLIIGMSFVSGFILSIFLVFIIQFVNSLKEK